MWVAPRWRMRRYALALGLALLAGGVAQALTLDAPRIQATLMSDSAKDPFRIRGRLSGGTGGIHYAPPGVEPPLKVKKVERFVWG